MLAGSVRLSACASVGRYSGIFICTFSVFVVLSVRRPVFRRALRNDALGCLILGLFRCPRFGDPCPGIPGVSRSLRAKARVLSRHRKSKIFRKISFKCWLCIGQEGQHAISLRGRVVCVSFRFRVSIGHVEFAGLRICERRHRKTSYSEFRLCEGLPVERNTAHAEDEGNSRSDPEA